MQLSVLEASCNRQRLPALIAAAPVGNGRYRKEDYKQAWQPASQEIANLCCTLYQYAPGTSESEAATTPMMLLLLLQPLH
jgi:hypothetical protein